MQMLQSGREVITVNGNLPNNNFQAFISNLTLEDLYVNSYFNYTEQAVTPEITTANTTAGRQLLNSIGREFPSIHSSLEIENTTSVSVLQILIEFFQQVDITQLKIDMQFKMHSILDITDKKCIQDSTLLPVKKKFMFYYWFAYDSNVNYVQLWTKNFRPFMNQEHSTELKAWETEVNQATVPYDEARENSFKNFISKIRNKQVFVFKPVSPFMEKKRPFESSPKNQNQDKRRKFDGNKNVTSKIPAFIPIVRRPVSNAISCNVHINTLERKSTVQSYELGITHVIAVDIDLKPIKIIFKAYYIPPYGLTMEENFNVLPPCPYQF
jgi:hypothetical protein